MRVSRADGIAAAGLLAAVLAVYAQIVQFDFVLSDDVMYVTDNDVVKSGLGWRSAAWAFTAREASNWHPLTWLSLMLDAELFGPGPAGFHATNLLLHAATVLLCFAFLRAASARVLPSACAAALLAVHPIHVESVAWVSQRKDLLSGAAGFASLWAYVGFARHGGARRYLLLCSVFAAGLLAKPALVTWPCVMLLLDVWPLGRLRLRGVAAPPPGVGPGLEPAAPVPLARLLLEKLPLFAMALASSLVTLQVQEQAMWGAQGLLLPERLANAVTAYVRYLRLLVWPDAFAVFYPHPSLPGGTPLRAAQVAAALALLGALSALAWWRRGRAPWLLVGWLWFLGVLVPMLGLVQVGQQALADRYAYLSFPGLYLALCWSADAWLRSARPLRPWLRDLLVAVGVAGLVALGARAALQARVWTDARALFGNAARVSPRAPFALAGLATLHFQDGDAERALALLREALAVAPDDVGVLNNLAVLLAGQGELDEAIRLLERVLEIAPGRPTRLLQLGKLLHGAGRLGEAEARYRETILRGGPTSREVAEARRLLAALLRQRGMEDEADAQLALAAELHRERLRSGFAAGREQQALGEIALDRGDWEAARTHFEAALAEPSPAPAAVAGLARTLFDHPDPARRDPGRALALAERAFEASGRRDAEGGLLLARLYAALGRRAEAVETVQAALAAGAAVGTAERLLRLRAALESPGPATASGAD
jgi:tetratricopeptide (TPR) repeat protein